MRDDRAIQSQRRARRKSSEVKERGNKYRILLLIMIIILIMLMSIAEGQL